MSDAERLKSLLKPEFVNSSLNLASKSITEWGEWNRAEGFPIQGGWSDKLTFIDNELQSVLNPLQHRPNDRMFWRVRPDLNKYRGWLLNKILQHQLAIQNGTDNGKFILPEDLPKLADDLYVFHKHHKEIGKENGVSAGTLQHYKTLSHLHEAIMPYAPTFPFEANDRLIAHDTFILEHGGNGQAIRVAELKDGTEIIQVLSEPASMAYGTPRWCTAYRDQPTYFSDYCDDLLVMIDPDGQRWQFHFRSGQFKDENDEAIPNLPEFLADKEELAGVLTHYWEKDFRNKLMRAAHSPSSRDFKDVKHSWKLGASVSAFGRSAYISSNSNENSPFEAVFKSLRGDLKREKIEFLYKFLELMRPDVEFQDFLKDREKLISPIISYWKKYVGEKISEIRDITSRRFYSADFIESFKIALCIPSFKAMLLEKGGYLEKLLSNINIKPDNNDAKILTAIANLLKSDEDFIPLLTPYVFGSNYDSMHQDSEQDNPYISDSYPAYYKLLMSVPSWKQKALELGINKKAFSFLDKSFDSFDSSTGQSTRCVHEDYLDFCFTIMRVPEWKQYASENGYFTKAVEDGHLDRHFDKYEGYAKEIRFFGFTAKGYCSEFWPNILAVPEWKQYAQEKNKLGKMLDVLFTKAGKGKSLGHYFNQNEKNDPAKTLMFLMPIFYNRPEFRQGITQHISHALRLSKGETVHFKNRGRGRRPTVDISVEILKYASKCPEWYKKVSEEDVGAALENERSIAGIMIIAKAKALSHWRKAVTSSEVVSEFIGSNEKHFIRGDPIEGIITGYQPYQEAFGNHL